MLPIALNLHALPVILIGQGQPLTKRLAQLKNELNDFSVFCSTPSDELKALAGDALRERLPTPDEFSAYRVAMIVGLSDKQQHALATQARAAGLLTHVEDVPELCDFYAMSRVQRGDLTIAISTAGKSPGLSVMLREYLEYRMGHEWAERLNILGEIRQQWRASGHNMPQVLAKTKAYIAEQGWLPNISDSKHTPAQAPAPSVSTNAQTQAST